MGLVGQLTAQTYTIQGNELVLPEPIYFKTGTDEIKPESEKSLIYIKNYLTEKTVISKIRIEGHTSSQGEEKTNQILSEKRALSVCYWLVKQGIDCHRLIPVGFGSNKPIADNKTLEGRSANVRITIKNAELRGRAIGGMPIDGGGIVAGDPCSK